MKKFLLLSLFIIICQPELYAQNVIKSRIDNFAVKTGAISSINKATGSLSLLRFPSDKPLTISGSGAREKSVNFIRENAGLLGIRSGNDQYTFSKLEKDNIGLEHVTLQQRYNGVPVFDGLMKFHYDKKGALTSVNGNHISGIKLNVNPTISSSEASKIAVDLVEIQEPLRSRQLLRAKNIKLEVFQKGLVQGYEGRKHLVYEIEVGNGADVREFLFIDAHSRELVEQFTGIHSINRELYQPTYLPANLLWKEGDAFPETLDKWQRSEIESAGHIYNLMKNAFGRVGYDGADAKMITTHNNPDIVCPGALGSWNGTSTNFCSTTASDDLVAHEWAHAYTQYTNGLVYSFQSGALNESYSDIWGETVDLLNLYMDEGENPALRTSACGSSSRWLITEAASTGVARDMWNPNCYGDAGKVSDIQYFCTLANNGGVHHNSGVNNHAYALLVDGGTYNGQTINGIGLTKAAHIFWRAQSNYLTRTSDFFAQADALESSANDLLAAGTNLPALSTSDGAPTLSGQVITANDLVQLGKVLLAVEMRTPPPCKVPKLFADAPPQCDGAISGVIFQENFEDGLAGWTASAIPTDPVNFTSRNWAAVASKRGKSNVAFAADPNIGDCSAGTGSETGVLRLQSPSITIPPGTSGDILMSFYHFVATEGGYDGGNIKISINGGSWTLLPATAFMANGYLMNLEPPNNSSNPLAGEPAFSGSAQLQELSAWAQSQVNLSAAGVLAGQTVALRWELGTDYCGGNDGWYVDDILVYSCSVPAVSFYAAASSANESDAAIDNDCLDYVEKTVAVKIDKAPTQPVTATFSAAGTARQGANGDYTITPASVVLSSANLSQNVTLRIYDDAYVEPNETVVLTYGLSTTGNAFAGAANQSHTVVIKDNDVIPAKDAVIPVFQEDFNDGLSGWNIINGGSSAETWQVRPKYYEGFTPDKSPFLFADSRLPGPDTKLDEIIESPVFNTRGMTGLTLKFKQIFNVFQNQFNEYGITEVWNGNSWATVHVQDQNSGVRGWWTALDEVIIPIPDAYANENMKVRFRYVTDFDNFWVIDDVTVTRTPANAIQSAVDAGSAAYLGPKETAYFYGTSGNLIAKIENLTTHDYGCTTVEIDRAGTGKMTWVGNHNITKKTFKVTPTNNNPNGEYTITLYYTAAELAGFSGAEIKSMGKSTGAIGAGNTLGNSFTALNVASAYSTDFAYSATFNSGFSGFGLSDAPAADGPLPVTLVRFEGKNTAEGNLLSWTTTSEINSDYFSVEHSMTGKNFREVGRMLASENSSIKQEYQFLDTNYEQGITYYRLKQVDKDGKFAFSKIVAIDSPDGKQIRFFPNPVQSVLTMELPDPSLASVDVRVINTSGQQVMTRKAVIVNKGSVSIEVGHLPTGIYQIIATSGRAAYNKTVLKE